MEELPNQISQQTQATKTVVRTSGKNFLALILLVVGVVIPLIGLVGLLIMWIWSTWRKRIKLLITIPYLILLLSVALVIYTQFYRPFQMSGKSMSPTYENGEYLLTDVYKQDSDTLNKGDVVIVNAPRDNNQVFIKRIIGMPNEIVMLKQGAVYLNGKKVDESAYLSPDIQTYTVQGFFLQENMPIIIPEKQYFVLGDNRPYSSDSREWGFVPQDKIISKVVLCYWNCQ